jgi:hypothetical protein
MASQGDAAIPSQAVRKLVFFTGSTGAKVTQVFASDTESDAPTREHHVAHFSSPISKQVSNSDLYVKNKGFSVPLATKTGVSSVVLDCR